MQNLQNMQESFQYMQDFQIKAFLANNWSTFASRNRKKSNIKTRKDDKDKRKNKRLEKLHSFMCNHYTYYRMFFNIENN